jgi:hypothetical protein
MKRVLAWILLVLLMSTATGCYKKKPTLKPFASAEGRFSALTPAPLAHTSKMTHWTAGDVILHSYAVEHDDVLYVVNYFEVPVEVSDGLRKQMAWRSPFPGSVELVAAQQWTIKERSPAQSTQGPDKKGDTIVESFTAKSANGKQAVSVKLFWFKNRFYQVMVAHSAVPSYFNILSAEDFMASFKIQNN